MLVKLLENQNFDFGNVAVSTTMSLTLVRGVDISKYRNGTLVLRVEDATLSSGVLLDFDLYPSWPLPADPSRDYESLTSAANVRLISTSAPGTLLDGALSAGKGPAVDLVVKATKPVGGGSCSAMVTVGLLLWEA